MKAFIGIDVQERRGCCFAVIDADGMAIETGWFNVPEKDAPQLIKKLINEDYDISVGIDAPRVPLSYPRKWYWNGASSKWRLRGSTEKGYGRHCEIVVRVHGLANPQYTPLVGEEKPWMKIGFNLFLALQHLVPTYEVFPTASYSLLHGITDVQIGMDFSNCKPGPKDILDAFVAAATIREFVYERGCKVGGGDGLGEIILPRLLRPPVITEVLAWPEKIEDLV